MRGRLAIFIGLLVLGLPLALFFGIERGITLAGVIIFGLLGAAIALGVVVPPSSGTPGKQSLPRELVGRAVAALFAWIFLASAWGLLQEFLSKK